MIEVTICQDETTSDKYEDVAILRFAGSLSMMLEVDFGSRVVAQDPDVRCHPPVSLQVCHESRMHTLSQYRRMEHAAAKQGCFYFNPCRDVLWLSADFTDEPRYLEHLTRYYGEQLNGIKTLLAEEFEWEGHTCWCLDPFEGLKRILILLEDSDSDTDKDSDLDNGDDGTEDPEAVELADVHARNSG
jgi:hypothetical protein